MKTAIVGAHIVNEGSIVKGSVIIENGVVAGINEETAAPCGSCDKVVDATGCFILPGIIDSHVHFREPGLTSKADIETESRAAAYGGVTTYFDMPNTLPQTTTVDDLDAKFSIARQKSHVNYSFFFGATNDNAADFARLDIHRVPGVKLFMGSSTGNMLVDRRESLRRIFETSPLPIVAHCEDSTVIKENTDKVRRTYGERPSVALHPVIRSREACYESTRLAVELARQSHARLHVAHLSTAEELGLFGSDPAITAEACIAHLWFCDEDYERLGARIKCNPAVKTGADRQALRKALTDGRIFTVATDHAPHLLQEKQGGALEAASGMPMLQFSLVAMLELVDKGVLPLGRVVELMCHNPARLFEVRRRGFIREGYAADLVVVKPHSPWTVIPQLIQSKCGWSPMEGHTFNWQVRQTFCNGQLVYDDGHFDSACRGMEVAFR